MCPWRIILRNTEEQDDVHRDATLTDQCCLPGIKYKNFLSGSDTSVEISFHSTKYTSGLNLKRSFFFFEIHNVLKNFGPLQPPQISKPYSHHSSDLRNIFLSFTSYYSWPVQSPPKHRCLPLTTLSLSPHGTELPPFSNQSVK